MRFLKRKLALDYERGDRVTHRRHYFPWILLSCIVFLNAVNPCLADSNTPREILETSSVSLAATDESYSIPVVSANGEIVNLQARVCKPAGAGPFRVAVLNHGSPPNPLDRPTMQLGHCSQEAAQWFLNRGYAVAFALRRGYGAIGGEWAESYGGCSVADYKSAGLETARDIDSVVNFVTALPAIRSDHAVVVGQSAGGWGTIAYDSISHPKVSAFINMAGGRGGHIHDQPNTNCHPEKLVEAAGAYGSTASTPMLWIYTDNDTYFAPSLATAMHKAFTDAGGKAELIDPGSFSSEGHHLFSGKGGALVWGPIVEKYLNQ